MAKRKASGRKKSGKRQKSGKGPRTDSLTCSACRNFKAGKKGGWCARKDKKRASDAERCGNFDPRWLLQEREAPRERVS